MKTLSRRRRYVLVKLNKASLGDKLNSIKQSGFLKHIHKEEMQGIPFDEDDKNKHFEYKWSDISEIGRIGKVEDRLSYFKATAECEYTKKRFRDPNTKNILPKKDRTNNQKTDVMFIQDHEDDLYAIIYTFNPYELLRVKKLIGMQNIICLNTAHRISPDMFIWLFYLKNKRIAINNRLSVSGIEGFTGSVISDDDTVKGDSSKTADLIVTKALLANRSDITSIKVDIDVGTEDDDAYTTMFYLCENDSSSGKELRIMPLKGARVDCEIFKGLDVEDAMPLFMFFKLIPQVKKEYEENKDDFSENQRGRFLFQNGIDVIKIIMRKNGMSVDDIR